MTYNSQITLIAKHGYCINRKRGNVGHFSPLLSPLNDGKKETIPINYCQFSVITLQLENLCYKLHIFTSAC